MVRCLSHKIRDEFLLSIFCGVPSAGSHVAHMHMPPFLGHTWLGVCVEDKGAERAGRRWISRSIPRRMEFNVEMNRDDGWAWWEPSSKLSSNLGFQGLIKHPMGISAAHLAKGRQRIPNPVGKYTKKKHDVSNTEAVDLKVSECWHLSAQALKIHIQCVQKKLKQDHRLLLITFQQWKTTGPHTHFSVSRRSVSRWCLYPEVVRVHVSDYQSVLSLFQNPHNSQARSPWSDKHQKNRVPTPPAIVLIWWSIPAYVMIDRISS